ncbi:tyrosinase family protein [Streptomyces sp. NPDC002928]|uniref:tyrosinase family protein n=1 Tax=Streptomyces sp. NPDC002928 TaxID=3154440 RepID=UPI0033BF80D4
MTRCVTPIGWRRGCCEQGAIPTAAQGPIFWLHHSNADRWWSRPVEQGKHESQRLDVACEASKPRT